MDVPDGLGDALPYVAEVVLGIRLIWGMVKTERELDGVELTDRSSSPSEDYLAVLAGQRQWIATTNFAAVAPASPR